VKLAEYPGDQIITCYAPSPDETLTDKINNLA